MPPANTSDCGTETWKIAGLGCLLILSVAVAYHKTLSVPFVFDDGLAIVDNTTIRHLWSLGTVLNPPHDTGATINSRPVLNLSLAINYAVGKKNVTGYHVANVVIHALSALTLFGIIRRTLLNLESNERLRKASLGLGFSVAWIWALHPLQTESVTYVVQRAESLSGLFYLLTLYFFIRGVSVVGGGWWLSVSTASCLLGMATKEIVVTAPLLVLLYDRTYISANFRAAWRQRPLYYTSLGASLLALCGLTALSANRGGTAGFGVGVAWWEYALTQSVAITRYLQLAIFPKGQIFDYGMDVVRQINQVAPQVATMGVLLVAAVIAFVRRPALGFAPLAFFLLLAPSSSIVPITTQTIAEHRMYLPLASLVAVGVIGLFMAVGHRSLLFFICSGIGLGFLTLRRNDTYRTPVTLWADTVAKRPQNPRAQNNLGTALIGSGDLPAALNCFTIALRLLPNYPETHNNLGYALAKSGHLPEAMAHYQEALEIKPKNAAAHDNLGNALNDLGRTAEAISHFEAALRIKPDLADAHWGLGNSLVQSNRIDTALEQYREATQLDPSFAEAYFALATAEEQLGRTAEATKDYEEAIRLQPNYPEAQNNLANIFLLTKRNDDALRLFRRAIKSKATYAEARINLANALLEMDRAEEALDEYKAVLGILPHNVPALYGSGNALAQLNRMPEAVSAYEDTLRQKPDEVPARVNLGNALFSLGQIEAAASAYEEALRLKPNDRTAIENLARAREALSAASK